MDLLLPAEAEPLPVPLEYRGRRRRKKAEFPDLVRTVDELLEIIFVSTGTIESIEESQRLAYSLIHHCRLTPEVLMYLDRMYLRPFSNLKWKTDIRPLFLDSLDTRVYTDHRAIRPYLLCRSRLPIGIFEHILSELDQSRRILGDMSNLENESAKQNYMSPIPSTMLALFCGRLVNLPEKLLHGTIETSGRCEYTISLLGQTMVLFIEYKESLEGTHDKHSDIIAQVIGEADAGDLYNELEEFGGLPIHAILTDGKIFEFYIVNFADMGLYRGIGTAEKGIPFHEEHRIRLPPSERDPGYVPQLKIIVEVLFDIFLQSYVNGIYGRKSYSERRARIQKMPQGEGCVPRRSTTVWDSTYLYGLQALNLLREAHELRSLDVKKAEDMAIQGIATLEKSVKTIPSSADWSFLDNGESRKLSILRV